jgi:hypothetical protein
VNRPSNISINASRGPVGGRAPLVLAALIVTFVVTRVVLHASPHSNFDVGGYNVHHLFMGVLLLLIGGVPLVVRSERTKLLDACALVFGAGLALCLDEWVYLIATDGTDESYLLPVSLWGGVVMVALGACYIVAVWLWRGKRKNSKSESTPSKESPG